jgi:hypothetical protein
MSRGMRMGLRSSGSVVHRCILVEMSAQSRLRCRPRPAQCRSCIEALRDWLAAGLLSSEQLFAIAIAVQKSVETRQRPLTMVHFLLLLPSGSTTLRTDSPGVDPQAIWAVGGLCSSDPKSLSWPAHMLERRCRSYTYRVRLPLSSAALLKRIPGRLDVRLRCCVSLNQISPPRREIYKTLWPRCFANLRASLYFFSSPPLPFDFAQHGDHNHHRHREEASGHDGHKGRRYPSP